MEKIIDIEVLVDGIRDFYRGGKHLGHNEFAVQTIPFTAEKLSQVRSANLQNKFVAEGSKQTSTLMMSLEDSHGTVEEFLGTVEGEYMKDLPHGIDGTPGAELEDEFMVTFQDAAVIPRLNELPLAERYQYILNLLRESLHQVMQNGIRIKKDTFGSSNFMLALYALVELGYKIGEARFHGVLSGMCDISNIIITKTAVPNARISIYKDGCADLSEKDQERALKSIERLHVEII